MEESEDASQPFEKGIFFIYIQNSTSISNTYITFYDVLKSCR